MVKASDNAYPSILITEGTEPSAPASGKQRLYIDSTTHSLKATNSSGTDRTIEGGVEVDYAQYTSPVTLSATSEATANTIVTGNAVTYDGTTSVMVEFYTPYFDSSAGAEIMTIVLYDGSSSIGKMAVMLTLTSVIQSGGTFQRRLTPSNASHTYSIRGYVNTGSVPVGGGAGGSGNYMPGFIRITKV